MKDDEHMEGKALLDELHEDENSKDETRKQGNTLKGILSAFIYVFLSCISAISVQLIGKRVPAFELNAFRCGMPLVLYCLIAAIFIRKWPIVARTEIVSTGVISFLHFLQSIAHYAAFAILPVASVKCVSLTTQIVTGVVFFSLFWSETLDLVKISAALICITGIVLVMQPDFIFTKDTLKTCLNCTKNSTLPPNMEPELRHNHEWTLDVLGYILPVIGGTAFTLDILVLKKRPYLTENMVQVLFWSFAVNTAISTIIMFVVEEPGLPATWYDVSLVMAHGLSYTLMWPVYFYSAENIEGNTYTLINSTSTVIMLVSQYTFLSTIHPGYRNWIEIFGAVLVMIGFVLGSVMGLLRRHKQAE